MKQGQQTILLQKITSTLLGTYDFQELAKRSVELMARELADPGLAGAAVFRVHENERSIYAYAYSTKYKRIIDKILPVSFSELNISLSRSENFLVQTVISGQMRQSKKLSDFSRGALPDAVADQAQKIAGGRFMISFPILNRQGKAAGVLLLMLKVDKISGSQLELFETFAKQLGLAFSNVFAFERLMNKYEKSLRSGETEHLSEDVIPSVKFTLRVSPKQNRDLGRKARESGKTKAELIREILDKNFA